MRPSRSLPLECPRTAQSFLRPRVTTSKSRSTARIRLGSPRIANGRGNSTARTTRSPAIRIQMRDRTSKLMITPWSSRSRKGKRLLSAEKLSYRRMAKPAPPPRVEPIRRAKNLKALPSTTSSRRSLLRELPRHEYPSARFPGGRAFFESQTATMSPSSGVRCPACSSDNKL